MPEALPLVKGAPSPTCPSIIAPECGKFQEVKRIVGSDNCPRFVCECSKSCPTQEPMTLKPGESVETVSGGCCQIQVKKCNKDRCPPKESCPAHLVEKINAETLSDCCPEPTCVLPEDKCVYTMKNAEPGVILVKELDDTWSDGPCETCNCMRGLKGITQMEPICTITKCDSSTYLKDEASYVMTNNTAPGECCAKFTKVACKTEDKENALIKQIGESWVSSTDLCKTLSCVDQEGEAFIKTSFTKCMQPSDCDKGSEYKPSSTECCGECVITHCVMESGELLSPGETKTDGNGCTKTVCKIINAKPTLVVESSVCPAVSQDCPPQFLVPDETGCCQVCKQPEKLRNCAAIQAGDESVGAVLQYLPGHGSCKNLAPVTDWHKCLGRCTSGSMYSSVEGRQVNNCTCCQPAAEKMISVSLTCADGFVTTKTISVPTECNCLACVTEEAHDSQYQAETLEQSHAALVQQEAHVVPEDIFGEANSVAQLTQESNPAVSPEDIFGVPVGHAQLAPDAMKQQVNKVSAEDIFGPPQPAQFVPEDSAGGVSINDIFGNPQAQVAPEKPKIPVAEVSANEIFGMPDSEVHVAPQRDSQANLVAEGNQNEGISADDIFGLK